MTREELKAHCKKTIEMCEFWAHGKDEELDNNKIYQEHKLILELLEQEPIDKSAMMSDIYMEGVNMSGEYKGCWVRFKDIEKIVDKYIGSEE